MGPPRASRDGLLPHASPLPPATAQLQRLVDFLLSKSYAPSTLPNYYRKLSLFHSFLRAHNLPTSFPAAPRLVQLFIAYLHAAGHAPSSIRSHISALATVHKILDLPDPTSCFSPPVGYSKGSARPPVTLPKCAGPSRPTTSQPC